MSVGGQRSAVEVYAKAPDMRLTVTHSPRGESLTAFDGHEGWMSGGMGPPRAMTVQETEAFKLDADFHFPLDLEKIFTQFRVRPAEKIDDHQAILVVGLREGQPPVRLYFDEGTGLLVREVRYAQTPLGRMPTQIDYGDYREVDGEKIPFRWTLARPGGRFTIQIDSVQPNVPIDDSKFARPH